ncbi:MAG: hypothetical protein ACQESN_11305 [Thermotogota bacterium]
MPRFDLKTQLESYIEDLPQNIYNSNDIDYDYLRECLTTNESQKTWKTNTY